MAISEEEIDKFITKISMGKYAGKFHYDQLRIVAELHLTELSSSTAKIKELEHCLTTKESSLENYGRHHDWCFHKKHKTTGTITLCDCGFETALKTGGKL